VNELHNTSAPEMERDDESSRRAVLKAWPRKITWWAAAEIIGVSGPDDEAVGESDWRKGGYAGRDRRKGKPSAQRIPVGGVIGVVSLYKARYLDTEHTAFSREATGEQHIELSYTWIPKALRGRRLAKRNNGVRPGERPLGPMHGMLLIRWQQAQW